MHASEQLTEKMTIIDVKKSLDHWCEEFNLQTEELLEIIKKVGPVVQDVRTYLGKKLLIAWAATY